MDWKRRRERESGKAFGKREREEEGTKEDEGRAGRSHSKNGSLQFPETSRSYDDECGIEEIDEILREMGP